MSWNPCAAQDKPTNAGPQASSQAQPSTLPAAFIAPADVDRPPADASETASGIATKVLKGGSAMEHPAGNDCVVVIFTGWKRDGSLFSTSGPHGEPATQCLPTAVPGIAEPLKRMSVGEKWRIWVPARLGFAAAEHAHHSQTAQDLTFDVELIRILRAPATPANLRTPPANALWMPSGVALLVLHEGTGNTHPNSNSQVTVHYSGWSADGKLLESTVMSGKPAVFLVGTVMLGWREALQQMVSGEKARVWIPAALANGTRVSKKKKNIPSGDLVYEFELLAFQ